MSKQINIGGRIHSTEVGNVLAGANEVLDDTKQKKQNVINAEVDAEMVRLDQSKQNNLTFDNAPTEDSTNPVTSGGVYAADKVLSDAIEAILLLIPSAATALNKLADMAFVNSSVSTATATFRGTYNVVTDLELAYDATHEQIATKLGQVILVADNNDYAYVQVPVSATSTDIRRTERYKFNGSAWGYEYDLNTSGFTAAQWNAINSGITAVLVAKLTGLPTAEVLATMFAAKQDTLTFDLAPTALSTNPVTSGGVYSAILAVSTALSDYMTETDALIPSEATSTNKLTDKDYVDGLIEDITVLIPSEATNLNQLADKAYVLGRILAATPAFKGQFETLVELQAVQSPKAGDLGIVRTKDSDGYDVFTFYQYLNNQWNVFYTLSHHLLNKPATTGTTGAYPYNGMGRVVITKKMVNGVNTLTQEAFEDSEGDDRENTIYVIQYDFTLGEDITVPTNCVLEFDGGSISGAYTITGNNTQIKAADVAIFNSGVIITGTWVCPRIPSVWFSDAQSENRLKQVFNLSSVDIHNDIIVGRGTYQVSVSTHAETVFTIIDNTDVYIYGTIQMLANNQIACYMFKMSNNNKISGDGYLKGDKETHLAETGPGCHGLYLVETNNCVIEGIHIEDFVGDAICLGWRKPYNAKSTIIKNVSINNCKRQGISIVSAIDAIIEDCTITNISGGDPSSGIDIEPNPNDESDPTSLGGIARNILLRNNIIHDCTLGIMMAGFPQRDSYAYNIKIEGNKIYDITTAAVVFYNNGYENLVLENNDIEGEWQVPDYYALLEPVVLINNKITLSSFMWRAKNSLFLHNEITCNGDFTINAGGTVMDDNIITISGSTKDASFGSDSYEKKTLSIRNNKFVVDCSIYLNNTILSGNNLYYHIGTKSVCFTALNSPIRDNRVNIVDIINSGTQLNTFAIVINSELTGNLVETELNNLTIRDFADLASSSRFTDIKGNRWSSEITVTTVYPRPTLSGDQQYGYEYFDKTLNPPRPIYWTGTAWVDATGAQV